KNQYDEKLAAAYARHARPAVAASGAHAAIIDDLPDLQRALNELGHPSGEPDGMMGPQTAGAIAAFQRFAGLGETGKDSAMLRSLVQTALRVRRAVQVAA
ncbi:MAG: peptidoglycan-binding domain-containing protein, partial [Pseudomonadota bacterium]